MWDFIHIWHAHHGAPNSVDEAVEVNDRLMTLVEDGELLPLAVLIESVLARYGCATVEPIVKLQVDELPRDGGAAADEATMRLWRSDPIQTYERLRPAALRIRLASSMVDLYPCAYEILKFCRSRGLIAMRGHPWWPAFWPPAGFEQKPGIYGHAMDIWSGLETVLLPKSPSTDGTTPRGELMVANHATRPARSYEGRPTWSIVARQLESAFDGHGFTAWANLNGPSHGQLRAWIGRKTSAGEQIVTWRVSPLGGDGPSSQDLCIRIGMSMEHDEFALSLYEAVNIVGSSKLFACELSEFLGPAKPDLGGLFMANRDEWGPDSERVSIENPRNLLRILSTLKNHAIPWLNRCTTPKGTLDALCDAPYPFAAPPLPKMVLAWHVQDLERYEQLRLAFREQMKHVMSPKDLAAASAVLERTPPLFVS